MKLNSLVTALAGLVALTCATPSQAVTVHDDYKSYSGSVCTPYTSTAPDYSKVKFRATGVTNEGTGFAYVICALPMDSDEGWGVAGSNEGSYANLYVYFKGNAVGTDECTLTLGNNAGYGTIQTITKNRVIEPGNSGYISFLDVVSAGYLQPPTLVCRIAPKHTLMMISTEERNGIIYVDELT